jgi:Skp family chaperone for outer membrane proteins
MTTSSQLSASRSPAASPRRPLFAGALPTIAVSLLLGVLAGASFAPAPSVVCTVDLAKVLADCNLNANVNLRVNAIRDELDAKIKAMEEKIKAKKDEIELFAENSARWTAAQAEFQTLLSERNAEVKFSEEKLKSEQTRAIVEIYQSLRGVIATYASTQGIDYVMLNDSIAKFVPAEPTKTMDQIAQRRFLYVTPSGDITEAILLEMNKTYPLAPGASPPGSAAPASTSGAPSSPPATGTP